MQSPTPRRIRRTILSASLALAAVAVVTGCGGSSSPSASTPAATKTIIAQKAQPTPKSSNPDVGTSQQVAGATPGTSHTSRGSHAARPAAASASASASASDSGTSSGGSAKSTHPAKSIDTVGRAHVEKGRGKPEGQVGGTGVTGPDPCHLVSAAQAQTIIGSPVSAQVEAPLGPTCIYQLRSSKAAVTLAIETMSFNQAIQHMTHKQSVSVSGHRGYCGNLGRSMLFVQLAGGQVLNVTAPCGAAARLAHVAVGRLAA